MIATIAPILSADGARAWISGANAMPTTQEVLGLLDELDRVCADELERQDIDFKEWDRKGRIQAVNLILETVICLANGGGGALVVGVCDKDVGRAKAIVGVPDFVDVNQLRRSIYDRTDPRLSPSIEELRVPEGTGRILVLQVRGELRPYTDSQGAAKIRVGTECKPLTGSLRAEMMASAGESDVTAGEVEGALDDLVSPRGMENLRAIAARQNKPEELLSKSDRDFLSSLELLSERGKLRRAGLLLVGKTEHITRHFPGYAWSFARMVSSTEYDNPERGKDCLAIAIPRIEEFIRPNNPVTTVEQGLLHLEFRKYPDIAIREALMNAFAHADYRIPGLIQVRLSDERLEIANPGGLIGGIAPENILRHAPIARNATLVNALISLGLVNRNNLGIGRMYRAMLLDGKEPPVIRDEGSAVRVVFMAGDFSAPFRGFVEETMRDGFRLSLEHLLVLNYLVRHEEIGLATAAQICQQDPREARESVRQLVTRGILEAHRQGAEPIWKLSRTVARQFSDLNLVLVRPLTRNEAAMASVLDAMENGPGGVRRGMSSGEIRELTGLDEAGAKYLMRKMREKGLVRSTGKGPLARWMPAE